MERILAAVDGSEHASRAARLAADLAARYEVPLHIVHVMTRSGSGRVPPGLAEYERLEHMYLNEANLLSSAAEGIVEVDADAARRAGALTVETHVATGDPSNTIVDLAKELGADLIVLGSRGLGDLGGFLLGSVSHKSPTWRIARCSPSADGGDSAAVAGDAVDGNRGAIRP